MDSEIMELDYLRYLESTIEDQFALENYVNECIGITESTIEHRLQVFTESVASSLRTNWEKFKAWVKKVWAKFLEKLANSFSNPQGYLEQYKDIILNKKVKEGFEVTIPDHSIGVKRILGGTTIPKVQANEIYQFCNNAANHYKDDGDSGSLNSDAFREQINADYTSIPSVKAVKDLYKSANADSGDTNQAESALKQYFLGGDAIRMQTNDARLNMADMYEFCHDNQKIRDNIEAEQQVFSSNCDTIINDFEKFIKEGYAEKNKVQQQEPPKPTPDDTKMKDDAKKAQTDANTGGVPNGNQPSPQPQSNTNSTSTPQESASLLEANNGVIRTQTGSSTATSSTGAKRVSAADAARSSTMRGEYSDKEEYQNRAKAVGANVADSIKNIDAFAVAIKNELNDFKNTTAIIFKAKSSAALGIFKDYMDLIRAHVQDYVGVTKNVSDNKATDKQTNYNSNEAKNNQT